jgi:hypothetical protein
MCIANEEFARATIACKFIKRVIFSTSNERHCSIPLGALLVQTPRSKAPESALSSDKTRDKTFFFHKQMFPRPKLLWPLQLAICQAELFLFTP